MEARKIRGNTIGDRKPADAPKDRRLPREISKGFTCYSGGESGPATASGLEAILFGRGIAVKPAAVAMEAGPVDVEDCSPGRRPSVWWPITVSDPGEGVGVREYQRPPTRG
jgi:hypothetical protein